MQSCRTKDSLQNKRLSAKIRQSSILCATHVFQKTSWPAHQLWTAQKKGGFPAQCHSCTRKHNKRKPCPSNHWYDSLDGTLLARRVQKWKELFLSLQYQLIAKRNQFKILQHSQAGVFASPQNSICCQYSDTTHTSYQHEFVTARICIPFSGMPILHDVNIFLTTKSK